MTTQSIMIIDDDESYRYIVKRLLKKTKINCKIYEAENGQHALDFFESSDQEDGFAPTLIFLDINMPIMGGFEFLENFNKLRESDQRYRTTRIAMFSSSDRNEDVQKSLSYDFVKGFLTKGTLNPEQLVVEINKFSPDFTFGD